MTLPPFSAVLLVCGSRRLVQIDGAHAKVLGILRPWIESRPDDARIVTGDATGPDTWVHQHHGLWCDGWNARRPVGWTATRLVSRFTLNGTMRHENQGAAGCEIVERWAAVDDWRAWNRKRLPLLRNIAMVQWAKDQHVPCHAIGFVAPDAHTHGTDHTLTQCRAAGFASVERVVIG